LCGQSLLGAGFILHRWQVQDYYQLAGSSW
jgi:hypothetical protein